MITTAYIFGILLAIVWLFLNLCYFAIKFGPEKHMRKLSFWQFIDFYFYGVAAKGFKGLDLGVKIFIIVYMIWQLY